MALDSAKNILDKQQNTPLGGAEIDALQPVDLFGVEDADGKKQFFSFGKQPLATRDAGIGEKIGVVGAGDVWDKFILPTIVQRGAEAYVYDKKFEAYCWLEKDSTLTSDEAERNAAQERERFQALIKKAGKQDSIHMVQGGVGNMPNDLSYVMVLTPPSSHLPVIKQVMKSGVPIVVEKPLVATTAQADDLAKILTETPYPLYCIDWQVMHALPVLAASGLKVPFADTLQTEVQNAAAYARFQQEFDLKNVLMIDARFVEGGENQLGDIEAAMKKRPELFDYEKGGGMLFDLAVHPLNVLATLGFNSTGVDEAFLGKPKKDANGNFMAGVYERFGKEDGTKTGETYGRAFMRMGIEGGGQDIKTTIEAAKGAASNDGRLILNNGQYELRWEMFPSEKSGIGSKLEIKELATSEVIATSTLTADCYALIMQDISNFVKSGSKDAPYFPEHRDMIHAVAEIHTKARSNVIPLGEEVRQLKLDEKANPISNENGVRSLQELRGGGYIYSVPTHLL